MPVFAESSSSSTIAEQIKIRRSRHPFHFHHHLEQDNPPIFTETDPNPHIIRSSKSSISSLFLSPFSTNPTEPTSKKKTPFRGLGCTAGAAQQVSVPAVIRSSAEWEGKKVKKKKNQLHKRKKESLRVCSESNNNNGEGNVVGGNVNSDSSNGNFNPGSCMVIQDVWCGPGIGFSADAVVGSVDCVVARRNNPSGRGKIDGEKTVQRERERERDRERASFVGRRASVTPETLSFLDTDPPFVSSRPEPEVFGSRYYRHVRHPSPDGLAEIMLLQNSFMMGGRGDRFSDWRLDIDHMSYEQLLELGERIGYVSTGLKDDEIRHAVRKIKPSIVNEFSSHLHVIPEKKCSICQEDYERDDELGKLECGHGFHIQCIKQWLAQKNICPVCKKEPVARG